MSGVVFLDTETTGLDPTRHQVWEIGLIYDDGSEVEWQLPVDLARADPMGLSISRFYERRHQIDAFKNPAVFSRSRWGGEGKWDHVPRADIAQSLARLTDGKHIVGAIPSFDANFLGPWLRGQGQCPTWHYHLIDVEAMAVGYLAGRAAQGNVDAGLSMPDLPWNSEDLSRAIGVDPDQFDRHTALGDARWAKAMFEQVMSKEFLA